MAPYSSSEEWDFNGKMRLSGARSTVRTMHRTLQGAVAAACMAVLSGCAAGPRAIETASLVKADDSSSLDPEQLKRLSCQRINTEIDSHVSEVARLSAVHKQQLAKPPATLTQVWERSFGGGGGTAAAGEIDVQRSKLAGLAARLADQDCPRVDIEALIAAKTTK